jgi:hypothetical protein
MPVTPPEGSIPLTREEIPRIHINAPSLVLTWVLGDGEVGIDDSRIGTDPAQYIEYPDRCVQVSGIFGDGGSVTIEGSNDGTNWVGLTDQLGNPLVFAAAELAPIMEVTRYIRPNVTAGDETTELTITMLLRRALY